MDEKFLELRNKLDFARESSLKKVQRAEKVARELRLKFAFGSSIGGRGGTGNRNLNLDKIELPDIFTSGPIGEKIIFITFNISFTLMIFSTIFIFIAIFYSYSSKRIINCLQFFL